MKILFVCHRLPFPPNEGGKIRAFNMIEHLAKEHSVVVASLSHTEEELQNGAPLRDYCEDVIAEVVPPHIRWMNACKALATSTPSSVAYFWSPKLYDRIQTKIRATKFDAIIVHCGNAAQYVLDNQDCFRVLDYCDLDSVKWEEYSRWKPFPFSAGYALEAKKLRKYEHDLALRFQCCSVTTSDEKEKFGAFRVSTPCTVIPNGVDTSYFRRNEDSTSTGAVIMFLGRMDYFPNVDGVCYFATEVLPIIRERVPKVEFRIVGSNPAVKIRELAKIPGVVVTGYVPDVRRYATDATVSVAPLRIARGTQNKILESMAMGIPVVASREAAKGIDAVAGRDLLVAEDSQTFAKKVLEVLEDRRLGNRLSEAALKRIESAHQWSASMGILDRLLAQA
jgi:sugar transferase (PEP-CTERM/EpsH1 system associated)